MQLTKKDLEVSKRLNDGDVITLTYSNIDPNTTEFVLEQAPHKQWWKGVQVLDNTDGQIAFLEVQDQNKKAGPVSVRASDVEAGGHVALWKAKTFGIHTPMYVLADMEHVKGKRVTFRWVAD